MQVGFTDSTLIRIAHAINDSRVGLQAHADIQAVDEYGGHMGAVVFVRGFFSIRLAIISIRTDFYKAGRFDGRPMLLVGFPHLR